MVAEGLTAGLRLALDEPQDDVAEALAGSAQGTELVGDGRLDPDQPLALGGGLGLIADAASRLSRRTRPARWR
jgi:hypothetical protein